MSNELCLLQPDELKLRVAKVREGMQKQSLDAILISDNANIYYLSGRVYSGHVYVVFDKASCRSDWRQCRIHT